MKLLLDAGADVNAANKKGCTAVIAAIENGVEEVLQLLVEAGADVNIADTKGSTPLMYAAIANCIKLSSIQAIFRAGAHVNIRDSDGNNAVERYLEIEEEPDEDMILLLIAAGEKTGNADVEAWSEHAGDLVEVGIKDQLNLKYLCRKAIRDHLLNVSPVNLFCRIPQLKLPSLVTEYLLYNMSLDVNYDSDEDSIDDSDAAVNVDETSHVDEKEATDDYVSRMNDDDDENDDDWNPLKF